MKKLGCWLCIYIHILHGGGDLYAFYHLPKACTLPNVSRLWSQTSYHDPPPPSKGLQTLPRGLLIKAFCKKNTFPQNFRPPHSPERSRPATLSKVLPVSVYSTFRRDSVFPYSLEYIFGVNCTFQMISCLRLF
jgi:hypothetical protein